MPRLAISLLAATLLFSLSPQAQAAPADKAAEEKTPEQKATEAREMKEHFKAGLTHYSLGEFAEAAAEFREAYRIHHEPAILFNIGQAMRQMNDYRHAYFYYSQYLDKRPDASNRSEVEQFMAAMQKKMEEDEPARPAQSSAQSGPPAATALKAAPAAPAETRDAPAADESAASAEGSASAESSPAPAEATQAASAPSVKSQTFWTAPHIGGVAAGGAAVALGVLALVEHAGAQSSADTLNQRYAAGTLTTQDASLKSDVSSKGALATVGAIAGAVLLVSGAVLVFAF